MYVTCTESVKGTRLAKPVLSLGLMCLAFLTGLNRVAEYRNHWSDVIAGFLIGSAIAIFLVSLSPAVETRLCVRMCGTRRPFGGALTAATLPAHVQAFPVNCGRSPVQPPVISSLRLQH